MIVELPPRAGVEDNLHAGSASAHPFSQDRELGGEP